MERTGRQQSAAASVGTDKGVTVKSIQGLSLHARQLATELGVRRIREDGRFPLLDVTLHESPHMLPSKSRIEHDPPITARGGAIGVSEDAIDVL